MIDKNLLRPCSTGVKGVSAVIKLKIAVFIRLGNLVIAKLFTVPAASACDHLQLENDDFLTIFISKNCDLPLKI